MAIGVPIAPATGFAEVAAPIAVESCRSGNHARPVFAATGGSGPSPLPNNKRKTAKERKLTPAAVVAAKTDQPTSAATRPRLGPILSAAHPPTTRNGT